MDKFVETQLNICELEEELRSRFQDVSEEQFRNLTYEDLQHFFPEKENKRYRTKLLALVEELEENEVNIVDEIIRVERQPATNQVKVEVKEEEPDDQQEGKQSSFSQSSSPPLVGIFALFPPPPPPNIKQENLGADADADVSRTSEMNNNITDTVTEPEGGVGNVINVMLEPEVLSSESEPNINDAAATAAGSLANNITTTIVGTDNNENNDQQSQQSVASGIELQENSTEFTSPSPSAGASGVVNNVESAVDGGGSGSSVLIESGASSPMNNPEDQAPTEFTPPVRTRKRARPGRPSKSWRPLTKKSLATLSLIPTGDKIINSRDSIRKSTKPGCGHQETTLGFLGSWTSRVRRSLNFGFKDLSMMDKVLHSCIRLKEFQHLTRLYFSPCPSTSEEEEQQQQPKLVMGMTQMILLTQLPQLPQLNKIGLHLGLSIDLKDSMEVMLAACSNLIELEVERGFIGGGGAPAGAGSSGITTLTTLRMPALPRLNTFKWATNYGVKPTTQERATLIELGDEEKDSAAAAAAAGSSSPLLLASSSPPTVSTIIDFSHHEYKFLEVLELGVTAGLKLGYDIGRQFPNLISLCVASFWDPLLVLPAAAPADSWEALAFLPKIVELQLPSASTDTRLIEQILPRLPNLEQLWINNPSVTFLRALIRSLAVHTGIEQLYLITDFEFESALHSAILDLPYVVRTDKDREKLKKIKEYQHWEKFVKYFKIELPEDAEEEEEEQARGENNGGLETASEVDEWRRRRGIGRIQSLKVIHWEHEQKRIFMPTGDKMWSDLEFQLTEELIGYEEMPFPKDVLDEMKKLRKLETFLYYHIQISTEDWDKFAADMQFYPVQIEWPSFTSLVECKDSLTKPVSIKRERRTRDDSAAADPLT